MSAVTRLHLLSQSMLNVSCQKQKRCSSLPTDSPTGRLMEFVGEQGPSGPCSLLGVPGFSSLDMDDDECEVVIGIRPKSSPLPRRRSSESDMDSWSEPPLSDSRRVSFADAKGLRLVQVKEFDTWDIPKLPKCDSSECDGKVAEEYFLNPLTFSLPLSTEELLVKVREQKVELETIKLLPGTTILKGVIRVLNVSFSKVVYVRTTLDTWSSHYDLLAEYMPDCSDSLTDCFSFKLTLVPPFGEQGARVDFCLRYETPVGTFWANNNNRNYVLFCHQREKEKLNKKSCLKTVSQNFSAVENISASEASSQENISADGSEHGVEADCMKAKQICDGQSATSEADRHTSLTESRQNCSRRSHRKTARMARVKDYFSQRKGGDDDTVRDESPPEAKQTTEEEAHSDVRSFPEGSSKSEGSSHFVSKSLETCSEPLLDDTSPAHDHTCNGETGKSKSICVADSGGERSTDIQDNPSNDEPAPAGCQDINKSVSEVEESSQKQSKRHESISNIAAERADSGVSAVTNSFTFGTVVAPLYHQVFGRMRSENPVRASLHVGSVSPSYPHTECRQNSCTDPTDASGNDGEVQGNYLIATQESNQDMNEEEGTSLSMTANNVPDHAVTLQDPDDIIHSEQTGTNTSEGPKIISGDIVLQSHAVNILSADVFNPIIPTEGLHLREEAREDNLTYDLQVPERTCRQTTTNRDETLAQSKTQEVMTSLESSSMSPPPSQSVSECVSDETDQQTSSSGQNDCRRVSESNKDDDVSKTVTISTTNAVSEKDQTFDTLLVLDPKHVNNPATKETKNSHACCFDIEEEQDVTTPQILSVDMNNVEEVNNKNDQKNHGDVSVEHKDEDARKVERREVEAAVAKQEDFCFDSSEVNWEMMVEEEEKIILTDEEECEAVGLKVVGKDQGQLEGEGRETPSENSDVTAVEKEDEDVLESKESIEEEEIGTIVVGKDREGVEKELLYVQAPNTAGEEELADELEGEETEEQGETQLEKEKLFEKRSISEKTNVQDEEEKEEEEEMVIDLNNDNEAGVEERFKSREVNVEEENPDYKERIPVDETGESEIVDAESESMSVEDGGSCFEGTLDITQNKVEDVFSAPVNNVQDKSVTDKENGHIPAEMRLYREEDFQSNVTCGLPKAARDENKPAAQGGWGIFTDEPESNQTGHDSASAESDSDDEMELYMHCLRAVHSGSQAQKDRGKDAGFGVGKLKHSSSRSKLLSTPMPSISESLDEEQHLSRLSVSHVDTKTAGQPAAAALLASSGQASPSTNVSRWTDTFSCSNISKTLLNATLLVVFLVVAYHYDFLACFGLYMISVVWLYCQEERQPGKPKNKR